MKDRTAYRIVTTFKRMFVAFAMFIALSIVAIIVRIPSAHEAGEPEAYITTSWLRAYVIAIGVACCMAIFVTIGLNLESMFKKWQSQARTYKRQAGLEKELNEECTY